MSLTEKIKQEIKRKGWVSFPIIDEYFANLDFIAIRNQLEEMGLDRHMTIEQKSAEIALLTPSGVIMQIRPSDNNQLGLWGGVVEYGESFKDCAIRELFEETGIEIDESQLELVDVHKNFHRYANGDKVIFETYRYIVRFEEIPKITLDEESSGFCVVSHTILKSQQDFIKQLLGEK